MQDTGPWGLTLGTFAFEVCHIQPSMFEYIFFSVNRGNHSLIQFFCICSGYPCVVLKCVWWSEGFKSVKKQKQKNICKYFFWALYMTFCEVNATVYGRSIMKYA